MSLANRSNLSACLLILTGQIPQLSSPNENSPCQVAIGNSASSDPVP